MLREEEEEQLEILYRDEHYVAVNKPAGLLVHRTSLDAGERRFCVQILRDQIGAEVYPCHRLDKPTSGILLFALDRPALVEAQAEFAAGRSHKRYLAIVRGWLPCRGTIDYPLRYEADRYDRRRPAEFQQAVTDYECLSAIELPEPVGRYSTARYSLAALRPRTGRKHQLRRHLAHLRHPIVGDTRHGDGVHNRFFRQRFDCHRLLLAATFLGFSPGTPLGHLQIEAAPGSDFTRIATRIGFLGFPPPSKPCQYQPD